MEDKVTVKIELNRDDISAAFRLMKVRMTEEQWGSMAGKECDLTEALSNPDMCDIAPVLCLMAIGELVD